MLRMICEPWETNAGCSDLQLSPEILGTGVPAHGTRATPARRPHGRGRLGTLSGQHLDIDVDRSTAADAPLRMASDARAMIEDRAQAIAARGNGLSDFELVQEDRAAVGFRGASRGRQQPGGEENTNGEKGIRQRADAGAEVHVRNPIEESAPPAAGIQGSGCRGNVKAQTGDNSSSGATDMRTPWIALVSVMGLAFPATAIWVDEYKSGIVWPEPPVVEPGEGQAAPADAIVLFDGENLDAWEGGEKWQIAEGVATAAGGDITTKEKFGDCQLHLEFATPAEVKGEGQGRGNSGVYLMGRYEVQILDSFENETYFDGQCGAIYKQQPPTVNACRRPGEWQTLDIVFTAPRFDADGTLKSPGYVTVLHNGVVIHNHFELQGSTSYVEPPKYTRPRRPGALAHPVSRQPGAVPQHLGPRKHQATGGT